MRQASPALGWSRWNGSARPTTRRYRTQPDLVTYAHGVLAETAGLGVPIVVLPFVNEALASRQPFRRSVEALRAEGVSILLGPGGIQPHPPHTGGGLIDSYPWHLALDEAERLLSSTQPPDSPTGPATQ